MNFKDLEKFNNYNLSTKPAIFQHQSLLFFTTEANQQEIQSSDAEKPLFSDQLPRVDFFTVDSNGKVPKGLNMLRTKDISVIFPEDVLFVSIAIAYTVPNENLDIVKITAYTHNGELITGSKMEGSSPMEDTFFLVGNSFRSIQIEEDKKDNSDNAFWITQISYCTYQDWLPFAQYNIPIESFYQTAVLSSLFNLELNEPVKSPVSLTKSLILKPNKYYRLKVNTSVEGRGGTSFTDFLFFKTDTGPGVDEQPIEIGYKDNPVKKLRTYISNTFPTEGAPNHYFGEKIKISFNETYVKQIFEVDNKHLRLRVRDRNGNYVGEAAGATAQWTNGSAPLVHNGAMSWLNSRTTCTSDAPAVHEPRAEFTVPSMKPNTLYFAEMTIDIASNTKVIHDFSFTTSQYENFAKHIEAINTHAKKIDPVANPPLEGIESFRTSQQGFLQSMVTYTTHARATTPIPQQKDIVKEFEALKTAKAALETESTRLFDALYHYVEAAFEVHLKSSDGAPLLLPDGTPAIVDMRQRGLPNRPELIQIPINGTNTFLLLLESPEPIDWIGVSGTYNAIAISVIANQDKTRAFLMTNTSVAFPEGEHTFILNYTPFVGEDDGLEVGDMAHAERRATFTVSLGMQQTVMTTNQSLQAGKTISSPNGIYKLTYQLDGDLVLRGNNIMLWHSLTAGQAAGQAIMQADGNLVIYTPDNRAIWSSDTWGESFAGTQLYLQDNGNVALVHPQRNTVWETRTANGIAPKDNLKLGEQLLPNQSLWSNNRQFHLTYQSDGNLVLYRNKDNQTLWASGTNGQSAGRFEMKTNGLLTIYSPNNILLWTSRFSENPTSGYSLLLADAGAANIISAEGTVINSIEKLVAVTPHLENFIAFKHTVTAQNVDTNNSNITILDHPQLNGNPTAVLFVSPVWGDEKGGIENLISFGVQYFNGRWVIFNQDKSATLLLRSCFHVMALTIENPHVFVHTATATSLSMNRSYIDHPISNNRPDALLMVTQCYGKYNNKEIGVCYEAAKNQWFIYNKLELGGNPYNEELNGIPLDTKFNVLVVDGDNVAGIKAFAHQANADNIIPVGQHISFLDNPAINNKPDAHLFFTESWLTRLNGQPIVTGGVANRSASYLCYSDPRGPYHGKDNYWSLNNAIGHPMEQGRMFNIFVLEE